MRGFAFETTPGKFVVIISNYTWTPESDLIHVEQQGGQIGNVYFFWEQPYNPHVAPRKTSATVATLTSVGLDPRSDQILPSIGIGMSGILLILAIVWKLRK